MAEGAGHILLTREELKDAVKEAVREELELIGLVAEDADDREKIRDDVRFMRRLRMTMNGVAAKIGSAVILAFVGGVLLILHLGFQAKFGR